MMRYKKGGKVEVLCEDEVPPGSWRSAEIIDGNGHNYSVKYDGWTTDNAIVIARVSRKLMRPCPPKVEMSGDWMPGDVLEVFHNCSWKMATVSEVLGRNRFLVRLVGCYDEFEVSRFELRVRQSWIDGKWVCIGTGKGALNHHDGKRGERSNLYSNGISGSQFKASGAEQDVCAKAGCFTNKNINCQESRIVSSRIPKRGPPCYYSQVEAYEGAAHKYTKTGEGDRCRRVLCGRYPSPAFLRADNVASTQPLGRKELRQYDNTGTSFYDSAEQRMRTTGPVGCPGAVTAEVNDADYTSCSTGSGSVASNDPFGWSGHYFVHSDNDKENSSDAESVCWSSHEEESNSLPTREQLAAEVHRLELDAYRCTLEALHASGPLSWEQETLMTNLRISLHITNDEHLIEAKFGGVCM